MNSSTVDTILVGAAIVLVMYVAAVVLVGSVVRAGDLMAGEGRRK